MLVKRILVIILTFACILLPYITAGAEEPATPTLTIGLRDQPIGDITLTESAAGNITTPGQIILKAPAGVTFSVTPTVTVTDGDLQIDRVSVKTDTTPANEGLLYMNVKSSSTKASTIKISGLKLTVDRTVPEGALKLYVRGTAIDQTLDANGNDILFPGHKNALTLNVANVVATAPVTTKLQAAFKIGDTKFSLNGVDQTMDAAPYLKNDRTYLPLRFVAKAVGIADSDIIWNGEEQSVTLIKDGSVVKLTIGSNTMTINSTSITMDTAPEVVDPGRTMLPLRAVAQALGCNIQWDETTQTVMVK